MFEFKIAFKYLLFKKKRFSSSLISLLSIFVISIVVWLVLVFLSVTNGIEKNWLQKLTSINAPIKITPTDEYYFSYYYLIDSMSSKSNYSPKSIKEKYLSKVSNPYDNEVDVELPYNFPKPDFINAKFLDPVKTLYSILEKPKYLKEKIYFQDFEVSAALLKLTLNRQKVDPFTNFKEEKINFLTQMSYLLSLTENNPNLKSLLLPVSENDFNHITKNIQKSFSNPQLDIPYLPKAETQDKIKRKINDFFKNISINQIVLEKGTQINLDNLKNATNTKAQAYIQNDKAVYILLNSQNKASDTLVDGKIIEKNKHYYFTTNDKKYLIDQNVFLHLADEVTLNVSLDESALEKANYLQDIKFKVLDNYLLFDTVPFEKAKIKSFNVKNHQNENFYFFDQNENITLPTKEEKYGILLPKNYQKSGVLIGDSGYLSYATLTMNSNQEQRIPIHVAGFYDPGVLPIGNKSVIVPQEVTRAINGSSTSLIFDSSCNNGIFVWTKDLKKAEDFKNQIVKELEEKNIAKYFKIETYKDFDFSKDLMQQFQSDKTLFTLISIIILIAACSNIISMLILLVNDKKKEIAILRSMGASSKSIALIFGFSGFVMGLLSSFIGILSAIFTLKHLDSLINFLSTIQGHSFFNAAFFGNKMPNELSIKALMFVLIITPIFALIAGLIPAIKASKIHTS
ncbi:MAG: FtsX-like permease family protein, partial [Parachlamydiales bacterium]|nr:FtsX-like permease family protein [Parachlamydiales bacterium]